MKKRLSQYIKEMAEIDQELRFKAQPGRDFANFLIYAVDAIHNYRLHKIIKEHGYPTKKLVGGEGMRSFWLLIQHQDYDLELQENCLTHCNFDPKEKAYLTDRVLINKGEKQLFGTQHKITSNKHLILSPVKDRKNLGKRRRNAGLEPLERYLSKARKKLVGQK